MSAIASGSQRASRVAARLALGKPAISATVESLCQRGLLSRAAVAGDQRAAALELTAEGEAVLARTEAEMSAWLDEVCGQTPDSAQVLRALTWLGAAMDRAQADLGALTHGHTSSPDR
jgi:DNA-binding MarR family transcriptional regulator